MKEIDFAGACLAEDADEIADRPLSQHQRDIFLAWLLEESTCIENELTAGRLSDLEAYRKVFDLLETPPSGGVFLSGWIVRFMERGIRAVASPCGRSSIMF